MDTGIKSVLRYNYQLDKWIARPVCCLYGTYDDRTFGLCLIHFNIHFPSD